MTNHLALVPDGAAFKVLKFLFNRRAGRATGTQLRVELHQLVQAKPSLKRVVLDPLLKRGYIEEIGGSEYEITEAGSKAILSFPSKLPTPPSSSPYTMSHANLAKLYANVGSREGALDYRDIPSLMGGERVPFGRKRDE